MRFTVTSAAPGPLKMQELLEQYANTLQVPEKFTIEQAIRFVTDQFTRQMAKELAVADISVVSE